MARIDLPPTKANLRKIKTELTFAYEGFDLLDQKREILVMEIVKHVNFIKKLEDKFQSMLKELYENYKEAAVEMGSDQVSLKSSSEKVSYSLALDASKLMGIMIPEIAISVSPMTKTSGFWGTTSSYDKAKQQCLLVLELLAQYASETKAIFLLSRELKKVQRRVNALEKIYIPQHEETKKYINERLEEMERDEIFIKKMIKDKKN